jgi:hypothetical protein
MKTLANWHKVPSVTTGGKPFFYKHDTKRLWIVWDRIVNGWALKVDREPLATGNPEQLAKIAESMF